MKPNKGGFSRLLALSWFAGGIVVGLSLTLGKASIRNRKAANETVVNDLRDSGDLLAPIKDNTAISQQVSEIQVPKASEPVFDSDIQRLSELESRFREKLPPVASNFRSNQVQSVGRKAYHSTKARTPQAIHKRKFFNEKPLVKRHSPSHTQ